MAQGYTKITGYQTESQNNYGFGLTLNATGKAPLVSKRIWDTKEHLQEFIDDVNDSAIPGLRMSVINDQTNNGLYWVESVGTPADGSTPASIGSVKKVAFTDDIESLSSSITSIDNDTIDSLFDS